MDLQITMTVVFRGLTVGQYNGPPSLTLHVHPTTLRIDEDALHSLAMGEVFDKETDDTLFTVRNVTGEEGESDG